MEHDIDKLTDKLSKLNIEPSRALFDDIYAKFDKKRKRRIAWWLFPMSLTLCTFLFLGYYFVVSNNVQKNQTNPSKTLTNSLKTNIERKVEIIEVCPTFSTESIPKTYKENKPKPEIISSKANIDQNKFAIGHEKNILNTNYPTDTQQNNSDMSNLMEHTQSDQLSEENNLNKPSLESLNEDHNLTINHQSYDNDILQLDGLVFKIDYKHKFSIPNVNIIQKSLPNEEPLAKGLIDVYFGTGKQQFCSYATADKKNYGIGIHYRVYKNIYLRMGASNTSMYYSYEFDSKLRNRFGQTDKFPALSLLDHRVQTISNKIDYKALDLGITANIFNHRKHQILASIRQEFILSSQQVFQYGLTQNGQYQYQHTNNSLQTHQVISTLVYNYKIRKDIGLGLHLSHSYSFYDLGMERERYSGINFGLNIIYGL